MKALFPRQLYSYLPALYPHLVETLRAAGITANELFALSYVKNVGKELEPAVHVLPISDLRSMLQRLGYSHGGASGFITTQLERRRHFLETKRLTSQEKEQLFPNSLGYRDVVAITPLGLSKLLEVRKELEAIVLTATKGMKGVAFRAFIGTLVSMAVEITPRLERMTEERLRNRK